MNKILALEFMAVNVSRNLNSMQKMSTQWNQRLIRYAFAKHSNEYRMLENKSIYEKT